MALQMFFGTLWLGEIVLEKDRNKKINSRCEKV